MNTTLFKEVDCLTALGRGGEACVSRSLGESWPRQDSSLALIGYRIHHKTISDLYSGPPELTFSCFHIHSTERLAIDSCAGTLWRAHLDRPKHYLNISTHFSSTQMFLSPDPVPRFMSAMEATEIIETLSLPSLWAGPAMVHGLNSGHCLLS